MPATNTTSAPGGEPLRLTVRAVRPLARDCVEVELASPDGKTLPACDPGAHIGLHLPNGVQRQYSLIESDPRPNRYRVGVKRDVNSRGGSSYIVEHLKAGDVLTVDPPRNNFPLDERAEMTVLFAGGIGITPIWCMVQKLEALGRSWRLHYAARARAEAPFLAELSKYDGFSFHCDEEEGGVMAIAALVDAAPANADLYCCGPGPMLAAFEAAAAKRDPARVHVEYFTQKHEAAVDGGFTVVLKRSGRELNIAPGQTIIQAVREIGVEVSSSCEEGICGACETRVVEGEPDHRDAILSPKERAANKSMFICCSGSKSARLVLDM